MFCNAKSIRETVNIAPSYRGIHDYMYFETPAHLVDKKKNNVCYLDVTLDVSFLSNVTKT